MQPKLHGGAGPAGGGDFAVSDNSLSGQNGRQFGLYRVVRRVTSAGQQTCIVQHGRSRADGRQPAAGRVLPAHHRANTCIGPEVPYAGSSGEKHQVEVPALDGRQRRVGVGGDAAPPGGMAIVIERGDGHLDPGTAQQINGGESLDFLKTISEQDEHGGHDAQNISHQVTSIKLQAVATPIASRSCFLVPGPDTSGMSSLAGKRLVIFGCGYVGSALAQTALAAGARVEALTRNPEKAAALRAAGLADVVVADLSATDWHRQLAGRADLVVNCVSSGGPHAYRASYVGGMASILAWAVKAGQPIGTLVYTSSTAVYPQGGGAVVTESLPAEGATPNGAIIRESEILLQQAAPAAVRRHFILRLAGIYGPGRHHLLDQLRAGADRLGGAGEHRLNLAHRDDIVSAIMACLGAPAAVGSEVFNVADSAPASRAEVVRWLAARLGRPEPALDGSATARRGGAPMPDRVINSARIRRVLGWHPRYSDYRMGYEKLLSL